MTIEHQLHSVAKHHQWLGVKVTIKMPQVLETIFRDHPKIFTYMKWKEVH